MLVELLLVADEGVERDLDRAAVEVAVEVEQMRLEQLLRRVEGRADAEAGDAGMLAAVVERHAHRIDAVARALVVAERACWRSDSRARGRAGRRAGPRLRSRSRGVSRWVAVPVSPACSASRIRPEEMRSPSSSTGATASAAMPCSAPSSRSSVDIAAAALAEGEVVAGDHARRADLLGRAPRRRNPRRWSTRQLGVELEHQHRVGAGMGEQRLALVERGQAERRHVGLEVGAPGAGRRWRRSPAAARGSRAGPPARPPPGGRGGSRRNCRARRSRRGARRGCRRSRVRRCIARGLIGRWRRQGGNLRWKCRISAAMPGRSRGRTDCVRQVDEDQQSDA